ncbi:nicotinamide-nucleotide adenylyltransferase [Candidatus Parvarchaeota archaeon]|nr:nicotinamide-nucleotide adenylyltransferase [Candidatus Parvarchaeota archaeon]
MEILFIGRFQPFHKGHLNTILSICKNRNEIKIVIGSKQFSFTEINPFTFEERKEMIERSLKDENIQNFKIFGLDDKMSYSKWFKELANTVGYFDVCYTGNKLVKKILLDNKSKVEKIGEFKRDKLSGTKIRKMILLNEKIEHLLPEGTLKVIHKTDGIERIRNIDITGSKRVFTVGHSTRDIKDFVLLMKEYGIKEVVDIRTIPKSRHNPQFNSGSLKTVLAENGIEYKHFKELGGLRKPGKDSINTFWENESFRGFADYMQKKEFKVGITKLVKISVKKRTAVMCAEVLPWNCHRSLIADLLTAKHFSVTHIINHNETLEHKINKHAERYRGSLVYK